MNTNIIAFAINTHQQTNHLYDGKPYAVHLAVVAHYAMKYLSCVQESSRQDVLAAAWLHDTIEDCRMTYNDIVKVAGERVADLVYAVTNEKGRNRRERANEQYYKGIRALEGATFVKLCDRLANIKYSKDSASHMLDVYRKEHQHFLSKVLRSTDDKINYADLLKEMDQLLNP